MADAVTTRLAELCSRHGLPPGAAEPLRTYLGILAGPHAPTTVRDPSEGIDVHIADALVALELPDVARSRRIADLGSGAGVPGLPLAIALPDAQVTLVESVSRKAQFLRTAAASLRLSNTAVVEQRAEQWREGLGACDLVTARALAGLPVVVEYAAPLLGPGGALLAWRGARRPHEEADGAAAAATTGLELREVRPVHPWRGAQRRNLHLYLKVAPTPSRFPRRPGMARKRPIRAST